MCMCVCVLKERYTQIGRLTERVNYRANVLQPLRNSNQQSVNRCVHRRDPTQRHTCVTMRVSNRKKVSEKKRKKESERKERKRKEEKDRENKHIGMQACVVSALHTICAPTPDHSLSSQAFPESNINT